MNLSKIMAATLEQFNEEVMKEFDNFIGRSDVINSNFIKNLITQKLTAHKELILKMVRERAPKEKTRQYGSSTYLIGSKGWNDCRQEFLDNLDTI